MAGKVHNTFVIQLEYDPEFEQLIAKGEMPDGGLAIRVGEKYLLGDKDHYVESIIMGLTLTDLLKAAKDAMAGATGSLELLDSGTYVIIEPYNEDTVAVDKCYDRHAVEDPDERLTDPRTVPIDTAVSEIVRVAEQWQNNARTVNPDITSVNWFENLRQATTKVKSTYGARQ